MVIVNVDVPAGPTIEEAIRECLDFSERCHCIVKVNLNDVDMLITNSPVFGKDTSARVKTFLDEFHFKLEQIQNKVGHGVNADSISVDVDLIEWYEDDIGQYEEKGLPRTFPNFCVPAALKGNDEAIGDYIMDSLAEAYKIKPVLVSWDIKG